MNKKRWGTLSEFVELFYERPLGAGPVPRGTEPLALREWVSFAKGRYDGSVGLLTVDPGVVYPDQRMNAPRNPRPKEWYGIVTDASGHEVFFVDADDESADPGVFPWDDEAGLDQPEPSFERLSDLVTCVVVKATLELGPEDEGKGPLGKMGASVRFAEARDEGQRSDDRAWDLYRGLPRYGSKVVGHLEGLSMAPWNIPGLSLVATADRSLLLVEDGRIVTRTEEAWAPIEALLHEEAQEREGSERALAAHKAESLSRSLESAGVPSAPSDLVRALETIQGRLSTLERIFLDDLRKCLAAGNVFDGQRRRAAEILAKHPR